MNSVDQVNYRPVDPIVTGQTSKVISSTNTLCRMSALSQHFQGSESNLGQLKTIWEKASLQLASSNLNDVKETMKSALSTIENVDPVYKIYTTMIDDATTPEALGKCSRKLLKDIASLSFAFEKTKTSAGINGPTYIVGYSRYSSKCALSKRRDYIVKWTSWNEIYSSRIYDALSQFLSSKNQPFLVPKLAALDFDKRIHDQHDCKQLSLEEETAAHLKQSYRAIAGKNTNKEETQIILVEKINGSNLFDFVTMKYKFLNLHQKQALFKKIGQLCILDLAIGNPDRLAPAFEFGFGNQFTFKPTLPANFCNVMIDWEPNTSNSDPLMEFYAIDNGFDSDLISNKDQDKAYQQFLSNNLCSTYKALQALVTMTLTSLSEGILLKIKTAGAPRAVQKTGIACKLFQEDLKNNNIAYNALLLGLTDMITTLKESLPYFWESEEGLNLKNYLTTTHPELLEAISGRLAVFNKK